MPAQTVTSAMTAAEAMACPGRLVKGRAAAAGPISPAWLSRPSRAARRRVAGAVR